MVLFVCHGTLGGNGSTERESQQQLHRTNGASPKAELKFYKFNNPPQ